MWYDDGYHCFGCGAHGDAIGFVMQSQGLAFMEAVGQLAGEAGLEVPNRHRRLPKRNAGGSMSWACWNWRGRITSVGWGCPKAGRRASTWLGAD